MALFFFGEFEFDERKGLLLHGGEPRSLRPQSAQLLKLLLDNSDRTVTKNEIIEQVWDGEFISDQVLFQCMNDLRKALGETAKDPQFVRTIPRKGYRWIHRETDVRSTEKMTTLPEITKPDVPAPSQVSPIISRLPMILGVLFFSIALIYWYGSIRKSGNPIILISTFENQTGDEGKQWLEKELQSMLIQELNMAFSGKTRKTKRIAKPLEAVSPALPSNIDELLNDNQAQSVFTSQIKQHGSEVQLQYQFYSKDGDTHEGVIRGSTLGETIHRYSAEAMSLLEETEGVVFSTDTLLNENYAQGSSFFDEGDYARARLYFSVCVDKDPDFVMGVIGLARCDLSLGHFEKARTLTDGCLTQQNMSEEESARCKLFLGELTTYTGTLSEARQHLESALLSFQSIGFVELEARCYEQLATLFFLRELTDDCLAYLEMARRAFEKQGDVKGLARISLFENYFSDRVNAGLLLKNALETFQQATHLPGILNTKIFYANFYMHTMQEDKAEKMLEDVVSESEHNDLQRIHLEAQLLLAHLYYHQKKPQAALDLIGNVLPEVKQLGNKSFMIDVFQEQGSRFIDLNQTEEGTKSLEKVMQLCSEIEYDSAWIRACTTLMDYSIKKGQLDLAESYFKRLSSFSGENDSNVLFAKGRLQYERGDYQGAVSSMESARKLDDMNWTEEQQLFLEIFRESAKDGKRRKLPEDPAH